MPPKSLKIFPCNLIERVIDLENIIDAIVYLDHSGVGYSMDVEEPLESCGTIFCAHLPNMMKDLRRMVDEREESLRNEDPAVRIQLTIYGNVTRNACRKLGAMGLDDKDAMEYSQILVISNKPDEVRGELGKMEYTADYR